MEIGIIWERKMVCGFMLTKAMMCNHFQVVVNICCIYGCVVIVR